VLDTEVRKVKGFEPGGEVFTLALASTGPLPRLRQQTVLCGAVEIKGLFDCIQDQAEQLAEARRQAGSGGNGAVLERLDRLERLVAGQASGEATPARVAALEAELAQAREVVAAVTGSRTWRYLAPARQAARRLRGR
jgi:hypothetical protein